MAARCGKQRPSASIGHGAVQLAASLSTGCYINNSAYALQRRWWPETAIFETSLDIGRCVQTTGLTTRHADQASRVTLLTASWVELDLLLDSRVSRSAHLGPFRSTGSALLGADSNCNAVEDAASTSGDCCGPEAVALERAASADVALLGCGPGSATGGAGGEGAGRVFASESVTVT